MQPARPADEPWVEIYASREFPSWMRQQQISLAFSTYQAGKLFLIGHSPQGISIFERSYLRCMGLWADGQTIWMSTDYQLWRLENALASGDLHNGYDRLYVPRVGYTTGHIDTHDVVMDEDGRIVFVNTKFNCLATVSERYSFRPLWRPPFVSKLVAEDRCHLNGLALVDGKPRYVTAVATSDVTDAWREHRVDGGCVVDVQTNEIVAKGLSMPHSPRFYRNKLWLHNSGTGFFGSIDFEQGAFQPLTFCPGYLRGLAFAGDCAIVGISRPRHDKTFGGLPLADNLAQKGAEARSGLHVIDLRTGDTIHWVRLEGMVQELYDVVVLPGVTRPMALGFKTDEIKHVLRMDDPGEL